MAASLPHEEMMAESISFFVSYAREDDQLREELEKHLSNLKWQNLIDVWHDRDISAGTEWEREIDTHLNTAQIILLLISPDFMASNYCYSIEMERAMERQNRGEARVIPIILRPVSWKGAPFSRLQALPTDAIPVTSHKWHSQDEAFVDVVQGIQKAIEELTAESPTSAPQLEHKQEAPQVSHDRRTGNPPQNVSYLDFEDEAFFERANTRNPRKGGLLVSAVIVLAVIFLFVQFIPFLARRPSQPSTSQPSSDNSEKVSDDHLAVMVLRVDSSSFVFSGDPGRYSGGGNLPTDIGAVLLARKTTSSYTIVLGVQNVQHTGNDILIDSVTLQLLHIPSIPRPLTVWTHSMATTDTTHPYPTTYAGQNPGQSLHAVPFQNVSLAHDEADQLDIQIHSTVSAYLQFKVAMTYHTTGEPQTLALSRIFRVIFSDASNWQEYTLQSGTLVRKS